MAILPVNPIRQRFLKLSSREKTVLLMQEYARKKANQSYHANIPEPKDEMGQYVKELIYWRTFIKQNYQFIRENMKLRKLRIDF